MKYKVGDKVKIRKDLLLGELYGSCLFVGDMQNLCGKTVRITEVNEELEHYRIDSSHRYWTDKMFEDKDIHIHTEGNQVIAINEETGKCGVARCHPDDEFNFYTGAKIALARLEEAETPFGWLKEGVKYYTPAFGAYDEDDALWLMSIYRGESIDKMNMKRGIAFKTREEAIACAKKMLTAVKQEG